MNSSITFQLTKKQYKQLQPLFDQAKRDMKYREPGMVLMQPMILNNGEESMDVEAGFIPHKQAVQIVNVIEGNVDPPDAEKED